MNRQCTILSWNFCRLNINDSAYGGDREKRRDVFRVIVFILHRKLMLKRPKGIHVRRWIECKRRTQKISSFLKRCYHHRLALSYRPRQHRFRSTCSPSTSYPYIKLSRLSFLPNNLFSSTPTSSSAMADTLVSDRVIDSAFGFEWALISFGICVFVAFAVSAR